MSRDSGRELRRIDLTWPPDKIRQFCELEDDWVLELDAAMSSIELEALYARQVHVADPYVGLIAEIAAHVNTPHDVLVDCARRFRSSPDVMSSLALRPEADEAMLADLLSHEHETVREHAAQALRRRHGG